MTRISSRSVGCVESSKTHRSGCRQTVRPRRLDAPYHPRLEPLEDRTLMSTCHVTRLSDSGVGKGFRGDLRYCINKVNTEPGPDAIDFTVTGTINLTGTLPVLASDMEIRGPGTDLLFVHRETEPFYRIFTVSPGVTVQITRLTVLGGVDSMGGGIYNEGNLLLNQVSVRENAGLNLGGGIYNKGTLTVQDSSITDNAATDSPFTAMEAHGAGIFNDTGGVATIEYTNIGANVIYPRLIYLLSARGAGVFNKGTLTLNYCSVVENTALGHSGDIGARGGGVYNDQSAELTVLNSTFAHNDVYMRAAYTGETTYASGGGIFNAGTAVIDNSTITENLAAEVANVSGNVLMSGAGVHNTGSMTLSHSTVTRNTTFGDTGYEAGGGLFAFTPITVENSIVALNSADSEGPNVWGVLDSAGFNLFGDPSGGTGYHESDLLNNDPLLGPLADNGGPTLTMALLPGSSAIDAGDNTDAPQWDQRGPGFPRIVNGTIDIGAFEVQATNVPSIPPPKKEELDGGEVQPSSTIGGIRSTLEPPPIRLELNSQPPAVRMLHRPAMETALASEFEALLTDLDYTPFV